MAIKGKPDSNIEYMAEDSNTPNASQRLFNLIIKEFREACSKVKVPPAVGDHNKYIRNTILDQGRGDYDSPREGLSCEELVSFYNYYYLGMHYSSSLQIFDEFYDQLFSRSLDEKDLIFIDFGCGTLASSLAFARVCKKHNYSRPINYLCIDRSLAMLRKAKEISKTVFEADGDLNDTQLWYCSLQEGERQIEDKFNLILDVDSDQKIVELLKDREEEIIYTNIYKSSSQSQPGLLEIIEQNIGIGDDYSIIFNFCYLFASESLNIEKIVELVKEVLEKHPDIPVYAFFQNPDLKILNIKWEEFKKEIDPLLKSRKSGLKKVQFFEHIEVKYEILSNA